METASISAVLSCIALPFSMIALYHRWIDRKLQTIHHNIERVKDKQDNKKHGCKRYDGELYRCLYDIYIILLKYRFMLSQEERETVNNHLCDLIWCTTQTKGGGYNFPENFMYLWGSFDLLETNSKTT